MLDFHDKIIYWKVVGITLFFGAMGWYNADLLFKIQYPLLAILVLLLGLPHGATDFLLYRRMRGPAVQPLQVIQFFMFYLLTVFGYLVCWVYLPLFSLILFLAVSVYHFGQSNGQYLQLPRWKSFILYVSWGSFLLSGALLWHWEESKVIVEQLLGLTLEWSASYCWKIPWFLLLINVVLLLVFIGRTESKKLWRELTTLLVLSFMLYSTPLLVGFTLYFTLWHSLGSLLHQVRFIRIQWPRFTYAQYYRQAAPYTLLAVIGLFCLVLCQSYFFPNLSVISLFFVMIACVTLPHIFLIEASYMQGNIGSNDEDV